MPKTKILLFFVFRKFSLRERTARENFFRKLWGILSWRHHGTALKDGFIIAYSFSNVKNLKRLFTIFWFLKIITEKAKIEPCFFLSNQDAIGDFTVDSPPLIRRRTALKKFRLKFDNGFKRTKERFAPWKITGLSRRRGSLLLTCPLMVWLDSAFKNIPAF